MSRSLFPPVQEYGLVMRPGRQLLALGLRYQQPLTPAARLVIQRGILRIGLNRGDAVGVSFSENGRDIEVTLPDSGRMVEEIIFLDALGVMGVKNAPPNIPIAWEKEDQPSKASGLAPSQVPIPEPPARLH